MKKFFVVLAVLLFCGCKSVEVSVERYEMPLWNIDGISRLKIAPLVGFGETHRSLATDLAEMTGEFLKTSDTYQKVEVAPLSVGKSPKGELGETVLAPESVLQLAKDYDSLLTIQVLSFSQRVVGSQTKFGFGARHALEQGSAEWSLAGTIIDDNLSLQGEAVVAFLLYKMPEGTLKERLICKQWARVCCNLYMFEPDRLISEVFKPIYNRILCHLHIHRSPVTRRFLESSSTLVSYAADAVLCENLLKAEEVLEEGIKKHPETLEVVYNYALVLEARKCYEAALEHYTQAQRLAGRDSFKKEIEEVKKTISALKSHEARRASVKATAPQPEPQK